MAHPLDGARLKVARAREHLDALKSEIAIYLQSEPYEMIATNIQGHDLPGLRVVVDPPLRLSCIIGDCVANARAVLDYTLWELAQRFFEPPVDLKIRPGDKNLTSFPIGTVEKPSIRQALMRLETRHLPASAVDTIQAVQPDRSADRAMWWLAELSNMDKHRMPLLTLARIPSASFVTMSVDERYPEHVWPDGRRQRQGRLTLLGADLQVHYNALVQVEFKDVGMPRESVDQTLAHILKCVADVVEQFESSLK